MNSSVSAISASKFRLLVSLCLLLGLAACGGGGGGSSSPDATGGNSDNDLDGLTASEENSGWTISVDRNGLGNFVDEHVTSDPDVADTDGDGLDDRAEFLARLDPRAADTDGDGLSDLEELNTWQTSATSVDSDSDSRGPDGNLAPEPRLFDGGETRLLCDDNDPGGICRHLGTSPTLADTDGDGRTDREEFDDEIFSPVVAEMPRLDVELVGDLTMRLDVTHSATESSSYERSTTVEQTTSHTVGSEFTATVGWGFEVMSGYETGDAFNLGAGKGKLELTETFSSEFSVSHSREFSRELTEAATEAESKSREFGRESSTGTILTGMRVTNPAGSGITVTVEGLSVTLLRLDARRDPLTGEADFVYAPMVSLTPGFDRATLAPGESFEFPVQAEGFNGELLREFMARPDSLVVRPQNIALLDAVDGTDYDAHLDDVQVQTALVEIDFGEDEVVSYRVATNGRRGPGGTFPGVRLGDVMASIVRRAYETAEGRLTSLDGRMTVPDESGGLPHAAWAPLHLRFGYEGEDLPLGDFDEILLKAGDELRLVYLQDTDLDGVFDIVEESAGTDPELLPTDDTDQDGLTDRAEIVDGWEIEVDRNGDGRKETLLVFSHPLLADTDGDGLSDLEEFELRTDPTRADTDGDGIDDLVDDCKLDRAIVLYVDQNAPAAGRRTGLSWFDAFTSLPQAVNEVFTRFQDADCENDVAEIWVADGSYGTIQIISEGGRVPAFRLYGGFAGIEGGTPGETLRGERDPVANRTVLRNLEGYISPMVVDGFTFDAGGPVALFLSVISNAAGVSRGDVVVANCTFTGYSRALRASSIAPVDLLVERCEFRSNGTSTSDNSGFDRSGGAILVDRIEHTTVRSCLFEGNTTANFGGAIAVMREATQLGSSGTSLRALDVQNCEFRNNIAGMTGGALWAGRDTRLNVSHSVFEFNRAWLSGGAVGIWEAQSSIVTCEFLQNGADRFLGGTGPGFGDRPHPIDTLYVPGWVSHLHLRRFGGAIVNRSGDLVLTNSTLVKNYAGGEGDDHYHHDSAGAGVAHLVQNTTPRAGPTGSTRIENSILWGNVGARTGTFHDFSYRNGMQVMELYSLGHDSGRNWPQSNWKVSHVRVRNSVVENFDRVNNGDTPGNAWWPVDYELVGPQDNVRTTAPIFEEYTPYVEPAQRDANGNKANAAASVDDPVAFDGRLGEGSPYKDAGNDQADIDGSRAGTQTLGSLDLDWYYVPRIGLRRVPVDLALQPRLVGRVDMGAYETQGSPQQ